MTHLVRGGVGEIFIGDAMQVVRLREQMLVERAQHAQHADRFFAARIERVDLLASDRCVALFGERDERFVANRAKQMAMQFDLRQGGEEGAMGVGKRNAKARCGHVAQCLFHVGMVFGSFSAA